MPGKCLDMGILSSRQSVDNPDLSRLGKSRIARKLRRKALDKLHQGKPYPKAGPPIPGSEHTGGGGITRWLKPNAEGKNLAGYADPKPVLSGDSC